MSTEITPKVGQRWLWSITNATGGSSSLSKVIFEIEKIETGFGAECRYIQVLAKSYSVDVVGHLHTIPLFKFNAYPDEFIYLEGQDKPS